MAAPQGILFELTRRSFREQYLGSFLGLVWAVLQPLFLLGVYAFVFVHIFNAKLPGAAEGGFVPFLAIAFWPWTAFSEGILKSTEAITQNASLVQSVAVPKRTLVLAEITATFAIHALGFVAVVAWLAVTGVSFAWIYLPVHLFYWLLVLALCVGISLIASAMQVFIRDVKQVLMSALLLWFFATPILYPTSLIPDRFSWVVTFNPFAYLAEGLRTTLLYGTWQPEWSDAIAVILVVAFLAFATWVFARLDPRFEDFL